MKECTGLKKEKQGEVRKYIKKHDSSVFYFTLIDLIFFKIFVSKKGRNVLEFLKLNAGLGR